MSVLIKGMEMPKDCLKCPFCLFAGGYWKCLVDGSHADFGGTCRPSLCPLVEVPPHGRLIDADALQTEAFNRLFSGFASNRDVAFVNFLLTDAPTVIPEDKEATP